MSSDEAPNVSLVIPAHNAQRTIGACLDAATGMVGRDGLVEIVLGVFGCLVRRESPAR